MLTSVDLIAGVFCKIFAQRITFLLFFSRIQILDKSVTNRLLRLKLIT